MKKEIITALRRIGSKKILEKVSSLENESLVFAHKTQSFSFGFAE